MSQDDDLERRKKLWRSTSPESRMFELIEKLSERVEGNAAEWQRKSEETQRNVDFIIRQQAQFTTDMQQLRESQANSERRWERTEESVRNLLAIAQSHENEITALSDGQARLTEAQVRLTEAQARLTEAQAQTNNQMAETDERLNALINFVERRASGERNSGTDARKG